MFHFLQEIDENLFHLINQTFANPFADWFFPLFNHAAPFLPFLVLGLGWLAFSSHRRYWLIAFVVTASLMIGDAFIFNPLKQWIARPRPAAVLENVRALASGATGGYSFPSSHTANAFLVATLLFFLLKKWRWIPLVGAFFIGIARIYVGVHYPSDVIGSAILGTGLGTVFFFNGRLLWRRAKTFLEHHENRRRTYSLLKTVWPPILALIGIQLLRLGWTATTQLDVPLESARLWCLAVLDPFQFSRTDPFAGAVAKGWFYLFGSSPLSLWGFPWFLQSFWLGCLSFFVWKRNRSTDLWSIVFISMTVPLISQLSFLGSPQQIFEHAAFGISLPILTWIYYSLLGFPLWIGALLSLRSHPFSSFLTLLGWLIGSRFPSLSWWFPVVCSSGTFLVLTNQISKYFFDLMIPQKRWTRVFFLFFVIYGLVMSVTVYNPRFLRKLDFSFLPRNHPHYQQMGWKDWVQKIRPFLESSPSREIWIDTCSARYQLQYLLGKTYRVRCRKEIPLPLQIPSSGLFYIREVHYGQIHPSMKFLHHYPDLWIPFELQSLTSMDIFRKGDPMRQFQLHFVTIKD